MKRFSVLCGLAGILLLLVFTGLGSVCHAENIGEKEIKGAVRNHIETNAPWAKDRIRVEFLSAIPSVVIPAEQATYQVRSRAGESYIGQTSLTIRFCKGDSFVREETIRVRIEVLTDVVVSTNGINRDAVIGPNDVTLTKKWLDTVTTAVVTDLNEVVGKKATVRMNPGTAITKQMFRSVPVVKKGEVVRIILESGPMMISAVGLCQEDGGRGDLIRVQNVESKNVIFARVMGQSLVKVDF
ncbi:MAG TPA: flagellar basal body P-ring formation chaperone FlgA [Syntrophales bacterium]|nr:flagellar basal body P-ring formation chaperone FlgA [Syntrophales bacterium]